MTRVPSSGFGALTLRMVQSFSARLAISPRDRGSAVEPGTISSWTVRSPTCATCIRLKAPVRPLAGGSVRIPATPSERRTSTLSEVTKTCSTPSPSIPVATWSALAMLPGNSSPAKVMGSSMRVMLTPCCCQSMWISARHSMVVDSTGMHAAASAATLPRSDTSRSPAVCAVEPSARVMSISLTSPGVTRTSVTEGEDCAAVFTAALSAYPSCEEKSPGDRVWAGAGLVGTAEDGAVEADDGASEAPEAPGALWPEQAAVRMRERMRAAAQRRCRLMRRDYPPDAPARQVVTASRTSRRGPRVGRTAGAGPGPGRAQSGPSPDKRRRRSPWTQSSSGELAQSHPLNYPLIRSASPTPGIHLDLRQVAGGYTKEY